MKFPLFVGTVITSNSENTSTHPTSIICKKNNKNFFFEKYLGICHSILKNIFSQFSNYYVTKYRTSKSKYRPKSEKKTSCNFLPRRRTKMKLTKSESEENFTPEK